MTAILKNFIGGEWVDGSGVTRNTVAHWPFRAR